jgi:hypothetical protein
MIQNKINKRSGRKCQDFDEAEKEYQTAQEEWKDNENNLEAWQTMFSLMNTAVFNMCNKKLEGVLDKEDIEGRALDITCVIMAGIKKKRAKQEYWDEEFPKIVNEVKSLSFFSGLNCKAKKHLTNYIVDVVIGQRPDWEVGKVSSYAYTPCLALYKKQLQFEDQLLGQDEIEPDESDMDDGFYHNVKTDWEYKEGYGYYE